MIITHVHFRESGNEGNQGRVIRKSKKDVDKGRMLILNMYYIILITGYAHTSHVIGASLVAQLVKNPPAMQETWVLSLGWEDPQENGKANQSTILAWTIPWNI